MAVTSGRPVWLSGGGGLTLFAPVGLLGLTGFCCVARRRQRTIGATSLERGIALTEVCPPEVGSVGDISNEGTAHMIVIGVDTYKRTHTLVALDAGTGVMWGQRTIQASDAGRGPCDHVAASLPGPEAGRRPFAPRSLPIARVCVRRGFHVARR